MNWTELLRDEIDGAYRATDGLMALVDEDALDWKPATGENWMPMAELLLHLTNACGWCAQQFVDDTWAEAMTESPAGTPTRAASVAEARRLLAEDQRRALACLERAGEEALANRRVAAPWDPTERPLGQQILQMVEHLATHKAQLFYYLKLLGKPVNTWTLWGLPEPQVG